MRSCLDSFDGFFGLGIIVILWGLGKFRGSVFVFESCFWWWGGWFDGVDIGLGFYFVCVFLG